jgi:methylmalonyl-CoA/ethylmalonyl-CoA epimerase
MTTIDLDRVQRVLDTLPDDVRPLTTGLDHIGVAVRSLDESVPLYRDLLGLPLLYHDEVETDRVKVAVFDLGKGHLELLEPTGDDSPIAKFIEKRGPGLHHVALRATDCARALGALKEVGVRLIDEEPRGGAGGAQIGFVHPKATGGILLELCQRSGEGH